MAADVTQQECNNNKYYISVFIFIYIYIYIYLFYAGMKLKFLCCIKKEKTKSQTDSNIYLHNDSIVLKH